MCERLSLLMNYLTEFFQNEEYLSEMKQVIDQTSVLSLRILDWFITNYSKKYRTVINGTDVYMNYKLMLKSFSKKFMDPFCRKNKILFYYTDTEYIETSCGQLCFFRWCLENGILNYVKENLVVIENDMKESLKVKKVKYNDTKKRQQLSVSASRSLSKTTGKYVVKFD